MLKVVDVSYSFGGVQALRGVSLEVKAAGITGLIGPNGAGKSTLVKIIAGGLRPSAGTVWLEGEDVTGRSSFRLARLGIIRTFQIGGELNGLTVLENLILAAPTQRGEHLAGALLGKRVWWRQEEALVEQARKVLDQFDMRREENSYAGELSGGQGRLVEIMRCVMARPRLLLLDEPMAGVNPSLGRRIEEYLKQLRDDGLTMIMVEHELGAIERCCDLVVVLALGQVISQGLMHDVRKREEVLSAYLVG